MKIRNMLVCTILAMGSLLTTVEVGAQSQTINGDALVSGRISIGKDGSGNPFTPGTHVDIFDSTVPASNNMVIRLWQFNATRVWTGFSLQRYASDGGWFIGYNDSNDHLRVLGDSGDAVVINNSNNQMHVYGTTYFYNGHYDLTPWPACSVQTALQRVCAIQGKMGKVDGEQTLEIDHASLPEDVAKKHHRPITVDGGREDFIRYLEQNDLKLVGELETTVGKQLDGRTEVMQTHGTVEDDTRDLGKSISYNVMAIQALNENHEMLSDKVNVLSAEANQAELLKKIETITQLADAQQRRIEALERKLQDLSH